MFDKFLHFLKEFPPWVILALLAVFMLLRFSPDDPRFYERIIDAVFVSLFTALGVRARAVNQAETKSGDVIMPPPENFTNTEDKQNGTNT